MINEVRIFIVGFIVGLSLAGVIVFTVGSAHDRDNDARFDKISEHIKKLIKSNSDDT